MNENYMNNGFKAPEVREKTPLKIMSNDTGKEAINLPSGFERNPRKQYMYNLSTALSHTQLLLYCGNKFYYYNGWHHVPYYDDSFHGMISGILLKQGINPIYTDVKFISDNMKAVVPAMPFNGFPNDPSSFLYKNNLVDLQTESIYEITPDYFATGAINANFNPAIVNNHPVFDTFLNQITKGDEILKQRIWEVLAYVISPEYRLRVIFCFIGVGGAGKSVLLRLIENLLTPSLVTNMSIANLATREFAESELENKRVCIASDEGNFNFNAQAAAKLKRISGGGETITVDVKMKAQTTFIAAAKILIASNYPIHRSAANVDIYLRERMMVIPFVNSIPPSEQDPYILQKLLAESDAIATHAFYVYKNLMSKNFKFSGDEQYYENLANMATANTSHESIRIFSENFCIFDGTEFTATETLFQAYMQAFPMTPFKDITAFSRAFLEMNCCRIIQKRVHTSTANIRGFVGVKLRNGGI